MRGPEAGKASLFMDKDRNGEFAAAPSGLNADKACRAPKGPGKRRGSLKILINRCR